MSAPSTPNKKTIFDEEITQLENRRANVEAERQMLLAGQITVTGPDGTSQMKIDLGALSVAANDQKTVDRNLKQTLIENPLVPVLDSSFKKIRELREEMAGRGELSKGGAAPSLVQLIMANQRLNKNTDGKFKTLGKILASPWLLLVGVALILGWCGGPLLYTISGGSIGGRQLGTTVPVPSLTTTPSSSVRPITTPAPTAVGQANKLVLNKPVKANFLNIPVQPEGQEGFATPTPDPAKVQGQVGNPASSAGGLNGPHGAFLAPSRLSIPALGLDTPVERALTQDNKNDRGAIVTWPRPGEVVHSGAYPGEIGNMFVMGNQQDLSALRRVQQNDEVIVYDRKGNAFTYRFLPFSASGQTEREMDPTSLEDAWVLAPTKDAILTILVTYPQPLPAVDPNQTGNNQVTPRDDYLVQKKLAYRAVLAMYSPAKVTPTGTAVDVPASVWQTMAATENTISSTPAAQMTTSPGANTPAVTSSGSGPSTADTSAQTTPAVIIPSGAPATGEGGGVVPRSQHIHNRYSDK
ncbi:MAG: hypothetical protein BGO39_20910 [Chloroflexi bacterium 54-19]|nr:MAG: hypothetical protein BGO39_20910 [Chloroflexi bacterium 54-19]